MTQQIRRDTGRALVVRPTRPGDDAEVRARSTPVSVPAQVHESDSGEHISVSRTVTPVDKQIRRAIDEMRASADPMVVSAFESIAAAALQQRLAYERAISADRDALEETRDRLATIEASAARWRKPIALLKGIGFGSVVAALVFCARALIAHGDAASEARKQSEMVLGHERALRQLAEDFARDRAQDAADHAVISILAARLGAAANP